MAIGANYITGEQVKLWMSIEGSEFDVIVEDVVTAISRDIEDYCHRQFNQEADASARLYRPTSAGLCMVDDFYTEDDLIVETDDGGGTFSTTWAASDYELRPLNGVRNGRPGFPYWMIAARSKGFKRFSARPEATVRVTAKWGWSKVPDNVIQAAKILASDTFQLKDSRMGVAGTDSFGTVIRVRDNMMAKNRLKNYVRGSVLQGG